MTNLAINTTQNVNIDFQTASLGDRFLAFILDFIFIGSYVFFISYFLNLFNWNDQWSHIGMQSLALLPAFCYSLLTESILNGQTFGKRIIKIKVIKIDGFEATFSEYLIRWVLRIVDIYSFSGVIAIVSIIINNKNQRLGDMAAGTAIISLKSKTTLQHTILIDIHESYVPKFPEVQFLSDKDARIIKNNFDKSISDNNYELLIKIAEKVESVLNISKGNLSENDFLKIVLEDFNYYTRNK